MSVKLDKVDAIRRKEQYYKLIELKATKLDHYCVPDYIAEQSIILDQKNLETFRESNFKNIEAKFTPFEDESCPTIDIEHRGFYFTAQRHVTY